MFCFLFFVFLWKLLYIVFLFFLTYINDFALLTIVPLHQLTENTLANHFSIFIFNTFFIMKKFIFSAVIIAMTLATATAQKVAPVKKATTPAATETTWNVDASHSAIRFSVPHMMVSETEGNFKKFTGKITAKDANFTDAKVEFTVDVNSINTDDEARDKHLKADDFFAADKYPNMTFKSTSFKKVGGTKYVVEGDLTIRNVTKKVKLNVTYGGTVKDPWGNTKVGFKAQFVIDRQQYGLSFNKALETGGAMVGNNVTIDLKFEFAMAK